jgi:hypothetical protein
LKLKEDNAPLASFDNLMEDKLGLVEELAFLACNIRKEVCVVLNSFLSFLRTCEEKNTHNMVF